MPHKFPSIIGVMYGIPEYKQDVTQSPTPPDTSPEKCYAQNRPGGIC